MKRGVTATLLFVLGINTFLFHAFGSMGLFLLLAALIAFILVTKKGQGNRTTMLILTFFGIVSLFGLIFRANNFVGFISVVFYLGATSMLVYIDRAGGNFFGRFLEPMLVPFRLAISYVGGLSSAAQFLIAMPKGSAAIGLGVGLPVAYLLLSLFAGADPIFGHAVEELLGKEMFSRVIVRIIASVSAVVILFPLLFLSIARIKDSAFGFVRSSIFSREMVFVSGLIAVVVGAFLIVQWPYVFANVAAETDLSQFGVATYSEYVKRGFFEFIFIAIILYALTWVGLLVSRGKGDKRLLILIQSTVLIESIIYIASLFRRLWLYQSLHGLTLGRIYGGFFLAWVALLFLTLAGRFILPKVRWIAVELACTAVFFLLFTLANVEHFIASVRPPTVNQRVDFIYLSRLSADGYSGWIRAYEHAKEILFDESRAGKKLLDMHDRQAIGYAGSITIQLTRNYHHLMHRYGLPEERRRYVDTVLLFQKDGIQEATQSMTRAQFAYTGDLLLKELQWIDQQRANIPAVSDRIMQAILVVRPAYFEGTLPASTSFFMMPAPDSQMREPWNWWDRVLVWNASEQHAYERIKKDIPFSELLRMQKRYRMLQATIEDQPDEEQGYVQDISFDGPFLESL